MVSNIYRPNHVNRVVDKFGAQTRLASALGISQPAVNYWVHAGRIPAKWHAPILEAARERGIELAPADLLPPPAPAAAKSQELLPALPIARFEGVLNLGGPEINCYVLSDGRRVISRTSATSALSGVAGGGDLASYVNIEPLASHLPFDLDDELIQFTLPGVTHKNVNGITAETFLSICKAYVAARDAGSLKTERQEEIAKQAGVFLAACATIGLIALIDEVTGYQYERDDTALQVKLRAYLEEEMRPWEKTFPDELWRQFGRLTNWKGALHNRPKYWGKLVNELVYDCLDADVAQWLRDNAPAPRHGQNYHQWLSSQYGLQRLLEHIWMLVGMASACETMDELRYRMAVKYGKQEINLRLFIDPPN